MSNINDFTIINVLTNGDVFLKKYTGGDADVIIPDTVTNIGSRAFSRCNFITGVSMPETVKEIGSSAFYECASLKSINIPDSVTYMSPEVFSGCTALTSVTLSQNIREINRYTFWGCKELKSITIPNSVERIEDSAFKDCISLEEVYIPNSVRYIAQRAFAYCISLEKVNIPDSVQNIANDAFRSCESLKRIVFNGNDVSFPVSAFDGCSSLIYNEYDNAMYLGSIENPYNWLIKAKDNGITSCEIHPQARVVCENAFKGCKDLKHLMIPASVVEIRGDAFQDCVSLQSIEVSGDSETYVCENGCLIAEDVLVAVIPQREISIPSSVKIIDRHAFCNCPETVSIELQDGVKVIRGFAFEGCDNLQNIEIADSVTSLDPCAFSGCSRKLKYLKIPKSIKKMRSTIPCMNGTIHIEGRMETFDDLPVDALKGTTRAIWLPEYCFSEIPASIRMNATLGYVYAVSMKLPKTEENSKEYMAYLRKKRVAFYPMLMDNDDLFNIMIDNKIIANDQIDNLIDLADEKGDMTKKARLINYSNGNSVVASDKLFDLDALEGVILSPDDAKVYWTYSTVELKDGTVGISIDSYKGDEKNVTVPAKIGKKRVVRINNDAFSPVKERLPSVMVRKRRGIESVVIPDGVVEIGKNAFAYSFVKRVVFPTTLGKIEFGAFSHCQQLEAVDITEECEFGGSFVGCKLLENSNKMVVIGGKLDSCSSAKKTSIQIPKSVTHVCAYAFYECSALKELVLHKNVKWMSKSLGQYGKKYTIIAPAASYGIEYAKENGLSFKEI